LLLLPFALLLLLEVGLRLADWGYPATFFLPRRVEGREVLVENPRFGWRFFPPAVARAPLPMSLPAEKPAGTFRVIVFGESAAMGDPEPAFGFARQLERLLQARQPGRRVEVINAAMTAINSHVIREIARDCLALRADAWVVYAGNNEVVGPFGAGTVFGAQAPGRSHIRAALALRRTRAGQLLERCLAKPAAPQWLGMELFLGHQVAADDARLDTVYAHFESNLADVAALGRRAGARVIFVTAPVNLDACPPFASRHRPDLAPAELERWRAQFDAGCRAEADHRPADAIAAYQSAERIDDRFAEEMFRRARCELAAGLTNEAGAHFRLARDLDTLRFRADSRLNGLVRGIASATRSTLVDAEADFGTVNGGLFLDHVHPAFAGNYRLAARVAAALDETPAAPGGWLAEEELRARLAFTGFDERRVAEEMRSRLRQAPFTSQLDHQARDEALRQALTRPEIAPRTMAPIYVRALASAPDDPVLRAGFARLLEAAGDDRDAATQWHEYTRLLPLEPDGWYHLGNLEYSAGRLPQAGEWFRRALESRADCPEAVNGLALALAAQGKASDAIQQLERVLAAHPQFSAARVNLALLLSARGDTHRAIEQYREALRGDPGSAAARINLARLLAGLGQADEALQLYQEAVELKPGDPIAHYDLANTLGARGDHPAALAHYAEAARLRPGFAQARYNLGVELARAGRIPEAVSEFGEAARLDPEDADIRYNYGIALAKTQRYSEAVREFEAALKRKNSFPQAREALERARERVMQAPGP